MILRASGFAIVCIACACGGKTTSPEGTGDAGSVESDAAARPEAAGPGSAAANPCTPAGPVYTEGGGSLGEGGQLANPAAGVFGCSWQYFGSVKASCDGNTCTCTIGRDELRFTYPQGDLCDPPAGPRAAVVECARACNAAQR